MGKVRLSTTSESKTLESEEKATQKFARVVSKKGKQISSGKAYINASFNNTIITITDDSDNVVAWATAGSLGFSGPKKATPFASSKIVEALSEKLRNLGLKKLEIIVKGVGSGRDSALRSFANQGFEITSIKDATPIPHNGPKPPKVRRV
jgi:small subunit ribosomal protein S11